MPRAAAVADKRLSACTLPPCPALRTCLRRRACALDEAHPRWQTLPRRRQQPEVSSSQTTTHGSASAAAPAAPVRAAAGPSCTRELPAPPLRPACDPPAPPAAPPAPLTVLEAAALRLDVASPRPFEAAASAATPRPLTQRPSQGTLSYARPTLRSVRASSYVRVAATRQPTLRSGCQPANNLQMTSPSREAASETSLRSQALWAAGCACARSRTH